jgi:signal peptidase I
MLVAPACLLAVAGCGGESPAPSAVVDASAVEAAAAELVTAIKANPPSDNTTESAVRSFTAAARELSAGATAAMAAGGKAYDVPTNAMFPEIKGANSTGSRPAARVFGMKASTPDFGIRRGDVVVFRPTKAARVACSEPGTVPFIKRVIGMPGDQVSVRRVTISAGSPYAELRPGAAGAVQRTAVPNSFGPDGVDERALAAGDTTYATFVKSKGQGSAHVSIVDGAVTPDYEVTFPVVPAGQLLVLGDNRPGSCDAHVWVERGAAFTPKARVTHRLLAVYYPASEVHVIKRSGG